MQNISSDTQQYSENFPNVAQNPLDFDANTSRIIEEEEKEVRRFSLKAWLKGIFIATLIILGLILYFSPKTILEPLKYYLNGDFGNDVVTYEESQGNFDPAKVFKTDGTIRLTEGEFLQLVNVGNNFNFERVESEKDKLTLFVNLAKEGNPLWLGLTIQKEDGVLVFTRLGFGRIRLPQWLVENLIQNTFGKVFNKEGSGVTKSLLNQLLGSELSVLVNPEILEFEDDEIVMYITKNPSFLEKLDLEETMNDVVEKIDEYDFNSVKDWFASLTNNSQ